MTRRRTERTLVTREELAEVLRHDRPAECAELVWVRAPADRDFQAMTAAEVASDPEVEVVPEPDRYRMLGDRAIDAADYRAAVEQEACRVARAAMMRRIRNTGGLRVGGGSLLPRDVVARATEIVEEHLSDLPVPGEHEVGDDEVRP